MRIFSSPRNYLLLLPLLFGAFGGNSVLAQPDYAPAHWVPPVGCTKYYTTGNGHNFAVIHDMEGYYWTTISYLNACSVDASIHYMVNGLQNGSDTSGHNENNPTDPVAGDMTQAVREQNYAWHARCWNRWSFGTEHEGFVSNPAWYTETMYQASAALQRHLCDAFNIPKDRNHIIGHNQWQTPAWVAWMATNFPAMSATCNDHTDPGQYWDWNHFMTLITNYPGIVTNPQSVAVDPGSNVLFRVTASGLAPLSYQWRFNGTNIAGANSTNYTRLNAQTNNAGSYSVVVTNSVGVITSLNAVLTLNSGPGILSQPQSQLVLAGQTATFSVTAGGTPPLGYQWRLNGTNLPDATNTSCVVTSAQFFSMGSYSVVVTNHLGASPSTNAMLVVAQEGAWGDNSQRQCALSPTATNLIAVGAGAWHTIGLRADGSITAWGNDADGECTVPPDLTNAIAIAAGGYHSIAIRADGSVTSWGANDYGQLDIPTGLKQVIGIAAGVWHNLALRKDGTVIGWGDDSAGQTNVPPGLNQVIAVAAGGNHNLALRKDGSVVAWGENTDAEGHVSGQAVVPWGMTNIIAIGAGKYHSLVVRNDGTVYAWGDNSLEQCDVPPGLSNVVAVAGGSGHSVALKSDGSVVAWGSDLNGQCGLSQPLNAVGVAAGEYHTVVLMDGISPLPRLLTPSLAGHEFTAVIQTLNRKSYALGVTTSLTDTNWTEQTNVAGNGALRLLTDSSATNSPRFYRMREW